MSIKNTTLLQQVLKKKWGRKKKKMHSFTKQTKRTRTTHKQKHTEETVVACSKKQISEKRNSKDSLLV